MNAWIVGAVVLGAGIAIWRVVPVVTSQRFRCAVFGHLPVTRYGVDSVQPRCFLCDTAIGAGWSTEGLKPPRKPAARVRKPRNFKEWAEQNDRTRSA